MKPVVAAEVEHFLYRPGLQARARYYGVIFLNQMVLSHRPEQGIGRRLLLTACIGITAIWLLPFAHVWWALYMV